jgi:hypothetical protein
MPATRLMSVALMFHKIFVQQVIINFVYVPYAINEQLDDKGPNTMQAY